MRAATGKTCDSAHNPTDPGKIALALRTFVHVPPSAFADFERKIVTALFVRNPEVAACKTPLISVRDNSATSSAELGKNMR